MVGLHHKVSIIIDNFNYDRFLSTAINSALEQTYGNCEIIVVDDGSTDHSRQILKAYGNSVRVILKDNGGQSSAFNAGYQVSCGTLIAFLDADDILFPTAIEEAVSAWREGAAKVQFPLEVIGPEGQRTGLLMPRAKLSDGNVLAEYLREGRYVTPPTSGNLFSRDFLERVFPIPEKEWAQTADGYINTAAPFFGSIISIHHALGLYRYHGTSMSAVCDNGKVDLAQMEKLLRHANLERQLLMTLARDRGLVVSKRAVVSHWMYLKLRLSYDKLTYFAPQSRFLVLLRHGVEMTRSLLRSRELPGRRKLQHFVWALCVIFLPRALAIQAITYAFDKAPRAGLPLRLRRV